MKKILLFCGSMVSFCALGQSPSRPDPAYQMIRSASTVQDKNYYLLTLFSELRPVREMLEKDQVLGSLTQAKKVHLENSVKNCKSDYLCYTDGMKFSKSEIELVGQRLETLYSEQNALGKLVREHLAPSGSYILSKATSSKELLRKAWEQDAHAVNFAIEVYAEGKKPNYPAIDSIAFKRTAKSYPVLVYDCSEVIRQDAKSSNLFFTPSTRFALLFLEVNERNEAADFEPMISTVNKIPYDQIKKTNWSKFAYSTILVPGAGPDTYERALSEGGILRCRLAAMRYFEGAAPYIIVSGGRVHPYKTQYSEAYEMKKFLVETLRVPEKAIIMDPHARHTTTNMRNAARLMFRYGIPMDKPGIVCTVRSQSFYITNDAFVNRCIREINHVPYKLGKRLSDTEFEFFPLTDALQIDSEEPLDP